MKVLPYGVLDTTLCDKVYQLLAAGQWFSPGTPVSSITDHHNITESGIKHHNHNSKPFHNEMNCKLFFQLMKVEWVQNGW
jgi:hypothetical protein